MRSLLVASLRHTWHSPPERVVQLFAATPREFFSERQAASKTWRHDIEDMDGLCGLADQDVVDQPTIPGDELRSISCVGADEIVGLERGNEPLRVGPDVSKRNVLH